MKLYLLTFKVGKCISKNLLKKKFNYKSKYVASIIYNKKIPLPKQKVITKIMNHIN